MSSLVLLSPTKKSVIKLTCCQATAALLKAQHRKRIKELPLVHRFFGAIGAYKGSFAKIPVMGFEMEYLSPCPEEEAVRLASMVGAAKMDVLRSSTGPLTAVDISVRQIDIFAKSAPAIFREALAFLRGIAEESEGRFDMQNPENWMLRSDGTMVMADPLLRPVI